MPLFGRHPDLRHIQVLHHASFNNSAAMSLTTLRSFRKRGVDTMQLRLLRGDLAEWTGDCIVNAANPQLEPSRLPDYWRHIGRKDVNSAIHARAGPGLAAE